MQLGDVSFMNCNLSVFAKVSSKLLIFSFCGVKLSKYFLNQLGSEKRVNTDLFPVVGSHHPDTQQAMKLGQNLTSYFTCDGHNVNGREHLIYFILISGKLPTYPSPKPTFCPK